MKAALPRITRAALAAWLILAVSPAEAATRQLSLPPGYQVRAGTVLEVPLTLDNAAGIAAVQVQINFDPEILTLEGVAPGTLGQNFELSHGEGDGFVQLTLARAQALVGGSGRLAVLKFRANSGASVEQTSPLTIAKFSLSDATGVIDLRQKDSLTLGNGEVTVSVSPEIDNAANGLPDWWEGLHQLDPLGDNGPLDPDNDGLTNLQEYAFGGNPQLPDAVQRSVRVEKAESQGGTFLSVSFFRRTGGSSLLYRLQESNNLVIWTNLDPGLQMIGAPLDMGDGTELVKMRGTIPLTEAAGEKRGFLRVSVEKP